MLIIVVQIFDVAAYISYNANTTGEGLRPTILPAALGKLWSLILVWNPV